MKNENELEKWFDNLTKKNPNKKILFLDNVDSNELSNIKNKYNNVYKRSFFEILFLDGKIDNQNFVESSSILCLKVDNNFLPDMFFGKEIIYVDLKNKVDNSLKDIILGKTNKINLENYEFDYIDKINLKNLIADKDELLYKIRERKKLLKYITGKDFDFDKSNSYFKYEIPELYKHLSILENKDVLTASFAHYLYKIFMLDFSSSATKVGLQISKSLNSKSKTFTYKSLTGIKSNNYNLKAYDLKINQIEIDTKITIAKNLLSLKKEKLDYKTIARVVNLPEKEVFNLLKGMQFSNNY